MRRTSLFQAHDTKTGDCIGTVITADRPQIAIRSFLGALRDPNTIIAQYPEDFVLLEIAQMDRDTGQITAITPPEIVITGTAAQTLLRERENGQLHLDTANG